MVRPSPGLLCVRVACCVLRAFNVHYHRTAPSEFGGAEVDSHLAKEQAISTLEISNGCLCCNLTGRLGDAVVELLASVPGMQLLIIETSGSALPAPLALELRRLAASAVPIRLDAIVNVVDVANFAGYEDTSFTAKLQAKYTDLILLNKHELVTETQLDRALDDIYALNLETAKVPRVDCVLSPLLSPLPAWARFSPAFHRFVCCASCFTLTLLGENGPWVCSKRIAAGHSLVHGSCCRHRHCRCRHTGTCRCRFTPSPGGGCAGPDCAVAAHGIQTLFIPPSFSVAVVFVAVARLLLLLLRLRGLSGCILCYMLADRSHPVNCAVGGAGSR